MYSHLQAWAVTIRDHFLYHTSSSMTQRTRTYKQKGHRQRIDIRRLYKESSDVSVQKLEHEFSGLTCNFQHLWNHKMTKNQAVAGFLDPSPCEPKSRVHLHIFASQLHLIMQFQRFSTVMPVQPHHRLDKGALLFFVKILFYYPKIR